jgi:hypothetical protein
MPNGDCWRDITISLIDLTRQFSKSVHGLFTSTIHKQLRPSIALLGGRRNYAQGGSLSNNRKPRPLDRALETSTATNRVYFPA